MELDRASIAAVAGAFARLKFHVSTDHVGLWRYLAGLARAHLMDAPTVDFRRVATMVWALAKAGWVPGPRGEVATEAARKLPSLSPPGGDTPSEPRGNVREGGSRVTGDVDDETKKRAEWYKSAAVCLTKGMVYLEPRDLATVLHAYAVAGFKEVR